MSRYGIKTLIYIIDNYHEMGAEISYNNPLWASSNWSDILDMKVDFDRVLNQLAPYERELVFNPCLLVEGNRHRVLMKMLDFLNKPTNFVGILVEGKKRGSCRPAKVP